MEHLEGESTDTLRSRMASIQGLLERCKIPSLEASKGDLQDSLERLKRNLASVNPCEAVAALVLSQKEYSERLGEEVDEMKKDIRFDRLTIRRIGLFLKLREEEQKFNLETGYPRALRRAKTNQEGPHKQQQVVRAEGLLEGAEIKISELWQEIKGHKKTPRPNSIEKVIGKVGRILSKYMGLLNDAQARHATLSEHPDFAQKVCGVLKHIHRLEIFILKIKFRLELHTKAEDSLRTKRKEAEVAREKDRASKQKLGELDLLKEKHLKEARAALELVEDEIRFLELRERFS